MKNISNILLSFLCLAASMAVAQNQMQIDGTTLSNRMVIFNCTDMAISNDILEIRAPDLPSSSGQFLECQIEETGEIRAAINYNGSAFFRNEINIDGRLLLDDEGVNDSPEILMTDANGQQTVRMRAKDGGADVGGEILFYGGSPLALTIEIDGNWAGTGKGRVVTDELQITGGSDVAENFDFAATDLNKDLTPGMLVSIDPTETGKLSVTTTAYDTKVAGVVSGANGVSTGLYMGQKGSIANGEHPVALAGRVYVMADASFGKIQAGDLLTTSPTKGHAMKVKNHKKAQGAIVGKAMSSLEAGQGYVLVLVNLQ